jgi:metal-responsive CopG/Arc/MetJ family transcriptional regulator
MRINIMTALSINLPDKLAEDSQQAAEVLGISRTQFIRQAVVHELEVFHAQREREMMAKAFVKMKKDPDYKKELQSIESNLDTQLQDEGKEWWKKKK